MAQVQKIIPQALLAGLNAKQAEAVTAPLGPALVLAGAGSGKTKVLTSRIAYLIATDQFDAGNILALTFTNKAAKEMQSRVQKLIGAAAKSAGMPTMGTFHSVCARILRQEISALGYSSSFAIYDDDDQSKVLKEICSQVGVPARFSPNVFRSYISTAKNLLQTPAELNLGIDPVLLNFTRSVYSAYQGYLFKQNALDFDDLLMLTARLLQHVPAVLEKYRQLFRYILVDEYQDTNHAQFVLLYLLANHGERNIFVVGDDAQAIYGFRGSNLKNILDFEVNFPDALVVKLEQNYRSTKNILDVAQEVIDLNPEQKKKKLWTENESGEKIQLVEVADEAEEAKYVARCIVKAASPDSGVTYEKDEQQDEPAPATFSILDHYLRKQKRGSSFGVPVLPADHAQLKDFAVLYRTHAQSRAIEEVFLQAQIPYQIIGGVKFYQRREIKDVLSYLRLVVNPRDLVALQRVINEPPRGIGEKSLEPVKDFLLNNETTAEQFASVHVGKLGLGSRQLAGAKTFFGLLATFSALSPAESLTSLVRLILKRSGYEQHLRDGSTEGEARWENVQEIFNVAEKYDSLPWPEGLDAFLEEVSLMTDADTARGEKDCVTMMSLHQAKGLEFDTVFLVGLEEGILPHSRSLLNPAELSEEVRLAYVGITRARKSLTLVYAQSRRMYGTVQSFAPSRFLKALPDEKINKKLISRF